MYRLYLAGKFGNKLRTWANPAEFTSHTSSGEVGLFSLRYRGHNPGKWAAFGLTRDDAIARADQWAAEGAGRHLITFNESAPDDQLILQGELMRSGRYFDLLYSTTPGLRMNEIRKEPKYADGMRAVEMIRSAMCPNSYDDLLDLFDEYEDSVIEFSAYNCYLGDRYRRNTVIWECRNY
jgi:hypothetical protein